jgi:D-glycero-D-manno-heptose 1,7-bisphosphate phosphatase
MERQLAAEGGRIDASYFCPHHPDFDGPPPCECRKPGTLMYRQAAAEHGLDLGASHYIGDRWRDVAPALTLGGHGILVPSAATPDEERERAQREASVAQSLSDAVARALAAKR